MIAKREIRAKLTADRQRLLADEVENMSSIIVDQLSQLRVWEAARAVHCYEPIRSLHEVNVSPIFDFFKQQYGNILVYTSRKIDSRWQIIDLQKNIEVKDPVFDVVIVPMLGFDSSLHRIGYGGGYYDRLLATQPQAYKVGVCYENGRVTRIPHESHDIAMDVVITEKHK